jgi:hypothetical protein
MNFYKTTTEKLKELKLWAQVKSPKKLQPALSYALDWLSPELLGTGFHMTEVSDTVLKGLIPYRARNFDFQNEVHQGLVLNAGLELSRAFLQKLIPESFFQIIQTEARLVKKNKWNSDLELFIDIEDTELDQFFIDFNKNKKNEIEIELKIKQQSSKKTDLLKLKLQIEKTELLG